jgi:hypothetical protein
MSRWETANYFRLLWALFVLIMGAYALNGVHGVSRQIEATRLAVPGTDLFRAESGACVNSRAPASSCLRASALTSR